MTETSARPEAAQLRPAVCPRPVGCKRQLGRWLECLSTRTHCPEPCPSNTTAMIRDTNYTSTAIHNQRLYEVRTVALTADPRRTTPRCSPSLPNVRFLPAHGSRCCHASTSPIEALVLTATTLRYEAGCAAWPPHAPLRRTTRMKCCTKHSNYHQSPNPNAKFLLCFGQRPNIRASAASVKTGAMGAGAAQQRLAASVTDKLDGCMR